MIPNLQQTVVLDTNVCLDLFVFRDPRWAPLLAAMQAGSVAAVTREDCRREWEIVLTYPHLPLDADSRAGAAAEFDALIRCVPLADFQPPETKLPVCSDKDDQKFLETMHQTGAQVLVTKDKALLKLAKRTARWGMFTIQKPEAWVHAWSATQESVQNAKMP